MGGKAAWRSLLTLILFALVASLVRGDGDGADTGGTKAKPASTEDDISKSLYFFVKKGADQCFSISRSVTRNFHVHYYFPEAATSSNVIQLRLIEHKENLHAAKLGRLPVRYGEPKDVRKENLTKEKGFVMFPIKPKMSYDLCASMLEGTAKDHRGLRLHLAIDSSADREILEKLREEYQSLTEEGVSMAEVRLNAKRMLREADLFQMQEMQYHKQTLRLVRNATWWPIFQVLLLLGTAYYQVRYLRLYFKSKRLV